jgi:hypothetical protein
MNTSFEKRALSLAHLPTPQLDMETTWKRLVGKGLIKE